MLFLAWLSDKSLVYAQTNRNLFLTGGPSGDLPGYRLPGTFDVTFSNSPGVRPTTTGPLPAGSLQIVLTLPDNIVFDDEYTPPSGWTFEKAGPNNVVLRQVAPISSSPPASIVSFSVPYTSVGYEDEGIWGAQIQRVIPTYQDTDTSNDRPNGTISVADVNLPVTLSAFRASKEGSTANLIWSTTEETNSDRFEVERSPNGKAWAKIGSIISRGESKVEIIYTFVDKAPLSGENLYRLKMVDNDHTYSYSAIRSLRFGKFDRLTIYPNPATEYLVLSVPEGTIAKIYSLTGVELINSKVTEGRINISTLISGVYMLSLEDGTGQQDAKKFVVQR